MEVALVRWPQDAAERERLAAEGRPRLLLVAPGSPLPTLDDDLEDWSWSTADPDDVLARTRHLARIAANATVGAASDPGDGDG